MFSKFLVTCLLLQLLVTSQCEGIKLNSNGGYDVVVTVQDDEGRLNPAVYIENIKKSLRLLSTRMWMTTEETFFINSAQITVPATWNVVEDEAGAPTDADIRISNEIKFPNVNNPNPCGVPGYYMEVPLSLFEASNNGPYGDNSKALLVQWARYRWGAWEEHGFPGNSRFPYFHKPNVKAIPAKMVVTGCSDAENNELIGQYLDVNGQNCTPSGDLTLDINCRFYPDESANKNVATSLMQFHWLESIDKFCDASNHQRNEPNRQNYFCDYKSVQETIQTSDDSLRIVADDLVTEVPVTTFTLQRANDLTSRPVLYVLLDRGYFDVDIAPLMIMATEALPVLFGEDLPPNVLASVGAYPSSDDNANVIELVSWKVVQGNEDEFIEKIGHVELNGPIQRDFVGAVEHAANSIKEISPVNGGSIVILKSSSQQDFSTAPYERELANMMLANKIKLFSIEIPAVNETRGNLFNLVSLTGGTFLLLNNSRQADPQYDSLDNLLYMVLQGFYIEPEYSPTTAPKMILNEPITSGQPPQIPLPAGTDAVTLDFYSTDDVTNISAQIDATRVFKFSATSEWGESDELETGKRFSYSGALNFDSLEQQEILTFEFTGPADGYLVTTIQGSELIENYNTKIRTSAVDGVLDFATSGNVYAPFVVSAEVTYKGRQPVLGLQLVATALYEDGRDASVTLKDDGIGSPDVASGDGVYSAVFVPPADGEFNLTMSVENGNGNGKKIESTASSRLLPIDQGQLNPCELFNCDGVVPKGNLSFVLEYGAIQVKNRKLYTGAITRIRDLKVVEGNQKYDLTFTFTAPEVLGETNSATRYMIYASTNESSLFELNAVQLPEGVTIEQEFNTEANLPGDILMLNHTTTKDAIQFYAIVAWTKDNFSKGSNVVEKATVAAPMEEDDKAWLETTGGIVTIVAIVAIVLIGAGGGFWYMKKRRAAKAQNDGHA